MSDSIAILITENPPADADAVVLDRDIMRVAAALRNQDGDPSGTNDSAYIVECLLKYLREATANYEHSAARRAALVATVNPSDDIDIWPQWRPGISVAVDEVYNYEGIAYEVIQAHTTQAGWNPPAVPALWRVYRDVAQETGTPTWQPMIWVNVGEVFEYQGTEYTVVQAHVTQADWTPDVTPALWQPVA